MHHIIATSVAVFAFLTTVNGQRITTIQLDGVQYFVSRMNPYSPELSYFLSYQYCRSLGLQLVSFETKEKADSITQYLKNAGYNKYDFWTSGNKLGTNMLLWMSTGLPFNVTFNYMRAAGSLPNEDVHLESTIPMMAPEATGRQSDGNDIGAADGCVTLKAPDHQWEIDDCLKVKDFICEQTRCYYYNYGSIPVSTSQGGNKIINPSSTVKPHHPDEGHLLNFTATRRITLRPPLLRKEDTSETVETTTEAGAEEGTYADDKSTVASDTEETYHDEVLGKVSRSKAIRLPTVDRLERKISPNWMFRSQEKNAVKNEK
ncbi:hypothetical protein RUM44_005549 [Polyplax serrata]|uniref:C-type lectin domain-containing protein n=1 Tax=Polyplax serrata TaxID=468196 RepID=A0ABR1AEZ9_POLSC